MSKTSLPECLFVSLKPDTDTDEGRSYIVSVFHRTSGLVINYCVGVSQHMWFSDELGVGGAALQGIWGGGAAHPTAAPTAWLYVFRGGMCPRMATSDRRGSWENPAAKIITITIGAGAFGRDSWGNLEGILWISPIFWISHI